jgi:hypothetical protein
MVLFIGISAAAGDNTTNDEFDWEEWDWGWWGFAGIGALLCFLPIIGFIIAIAIGVWMYRDAEKRGKNGTLWLLVGLIGGLIGLIIWIVVRPPELTPEQRQARSTPIEARRRCPDCGRAIPFDASVCPYCAKKFGQM